MTCRYFQALVCDLVNGSNNVLEMNRWVNFNNVKLIIVLHYNLISYTNHLFQKIELRYTSDRLKIDFR